MIVPSSDELQHWGKYEDGMCWGGQWSCCHLWEPRSPGCLNSKMTAGDFQMRCSQITQHAEIGDITLFLQILSERGTEESEIARWGLNGLARLTAGSTANRNIVREAGACPIIVRIMKAHATDTKLTKLITVPVLRNGCTTIEMMCFKDSNGKTDVEKAIREEFITLGATTLLQSLIANTEFLRVRMEARRALGQLS